MKICVTGHARCGKDTVCEILRDVYNLSFVSATDMMVDNIILPSLGMHIGDFGFKGVWAGAAKNNARTHLLDTKNEWRTLWFELVRFYNKDDPARHIRHVMEVSDIYCGVRDRRELDAAKGEGIFDLVVWVDASERVEDEPSSSITVSAGDADFVLNNNGDTADLTEEVRDMMDVVRLPLSFD